MEQATSFIRLGKTIELIDLLSLRLNIGANGVRKQKKPIMYIGKLHLIR